MAERWYVEVREKKTGKRIPCSGALTKQAAETIRDRMDNNINRADFTVHAVEQQTPTRKT